MNVKELISILEKQPPEMEVVAQVFSHTGYNIRAEPRDLLDYSTREYEETVFVISHSPHDFGWPVFVESDEPNEIQIKILMELADIYRPKYFGQDFKRFTGIFGDYRIYLDYGGESNKYGTSYDPRHFTFLHKLGLIEIGEKEKFGSGVPHVKISQKGLEFIENMEEKI